MTIVHKSEQSKSNIRLLFTIMMFVFMAAVLISIAGAAEDSDAGSKFTVDGISYETTSDSEAKVVSGSYTGDVIIPSSVKNGMTTYYVTSIDTDAFEGCTLLTSVTIGSGITSISNFTFWGCKSLTSVTIPNSVVSIGDCAFYECTALNSISVSSDNTTYSSENGVLFNKTKTTLIGYPAGKSGAYSIPNSVVSIGDSAFHRCCLLTSVTIGESVTSIGDSVFYGCTSLTDIIVSPDNQNYSSENGVLFNKTKTTLIGYPAGKSGAYSIPNSVVSIDDSAFPGCESMTSVTIPNGVTSISNFAFYECTALSSVTIGSGVTSIGDCAFVECTALSTIVFMGAVTSIGSDAFNLSDAADVSCTAIGCSDGQLEPYKGEHTTFTYKFRVTYDMNGGSGSIDLEGVKGSYTVKEYSGKKTGYRFIGWNDGTSTYSPGTSVNIAANTAYTAVWEQLYLVTYDVDGGTGSVDSDYVKGAYVLKSYLGTKEGYTFKGWSDGTGTYDAGASVEITKDTAYKAVWEKNSSDGGSNTGLIIVIVIAVNAVIGIGAFFIIKKK